MPVRGKRMFQAMTLFIRHRRPLILSALAGALATLLMIAAPVVVWRFYSEWRLGRVELMTVDAPVVCQVLAEASDTPIGEPFDLVTRAGVALPAGDYRLHVSGKGRLSRTYRVAISRGETQTYEISIDEGRLLGGERAVGFGTDERPRDVPIPFTPFTMALELDARQSRFDRTVERVRDPPRRRQRQGGLEHAAPRRALRAKSPRGTLQHSLGR